jgi:hypothetical protein
LPDVRFPRPTEVLTPVSGRHPDPLIPCPDLPPASHLTNAWRPDFILRTS